ncbi:class I poly(R)-hydroxyalkanoic acid synthase [Paracoccus sp. TK19116]|uniref:Class I poly(R)-hydroxyalkanoic acid synthase n=1 Tax=Paracoccus albicereus TaxID=2922394 RepID=A0ABT1MTY5_9RHOB|nr:class I poly(R)-hydroxyalkanoic acid synthase [Paracoccus albicereus]MCQ0971790.1 class I poly(R)-hydroxyalkanoic acid synthase [Paracoccus albicereus]
MIANLERIESLSQRLIAGLAQRPTPNPGVDGPGPELYASAASAWMKMLTEQPARVIEQQVNFWGETLKHYAKAQDALVKGRMTAPEDDPDEAEARPDKRFSNPLWNTHPFFNYVKKQYRINAKAMQSAAADLEMPDRIARKRLDWLTGQIIDMMAPTNFLATNPDALEKAVQTEGESLVRGLENLVRDVEQNRGDLVVSLADRDAFTVGGNIGTTEGKVVHRGPLYELIQYAPRTEQVHALPLVIFPPWINKFYILDLKPQNSLIRWLVDQGHTVFVVSWKNPDPSFAETGMEDYVAAYLDASERVMERTGQKKLNITGYCIAGTTLAATLGVLKQRGDDRVNSATFLTTLTDFSDLGEFLTFLQPDFVEGIREEVSRRGIFPAQLMSRTMSFLRANDLVWGPAIRSYMMGETPPAFDLLYWNGDSTNLPGRMTLDYIDGLCVQNRLPKHGFTVLGHTVTLADVTVPLCSVACETDHIAPWKDCWKGVAQMGADDKTFVLSESGHIAGIVNPPSKKKYGHYAGDGGFSADHAVWKDAATFREGSWWPLWGEWLAARSGDMVPARQPEDDLGDAPGEYVHERAT